MKIASASDNRRRRVFEVETSRGTLPFPYAKASPAPSPSDKVLELFVDDELGREAFTYRLASGKEGSVHVEQVLDYNRDPAYLRDMLLYRLTLEAQECIDGSGLSKREIIRRLGTSPAQLYRLLDPANRRKSLDKLLALLQVLGCEVDLVVRTPNDPRPVG